MPETKTREPKVDEETRILKWREERGRVAEAEKAERLRLRDEARAREAAERQEAKMRAAQALLPTEAEIAATETRIKGRARRAKLGFAAQFGVLCLAPFLAAAYYLLNVATPLYEARSVIAITTPGAISGDTNRGLLGTLSGPNSLQDAFVAQSYIQSQAMMQSLEDEMGLISRLSSEAIDPIQRLRDLPTLSIDKRTQFLRFVESALDIQTGLITLHVRSPDAADAIVISEAVLDRVASQVNALGSDVVDQRLKLAADAVTSAQDQLTSAQSQFINLQLQSGEANPAERVAGIYAQINNLQTEAMALSHDIEKAEIAGHGGSFQVQRAETLRDSLNDQIATQRALLVSNGSSPGTALNTAMMQHQLAELRVEIAEETLTTALAAQAKATGQAALTQSLFQVVVPPRTASHPTAPNVPAILVVVLVFSLALFAFVRVILGGRQAV